MSKAYIAAIKQDLPKAEIVFDRFHIAKLLNEAVDTIRREEQSKYHDLRKTRYLWLKNNNNLVQKNKDLVAALSQAYPTIGEAYRYKELFREIMNEAQRSHLLKPLKEWMKLVRKTNIAPLKKFVKTLDTHWYGIKSYFKRLATNAFAERVNLKIQEIKRTAKGFRNTNNYILMIYFHLGGLDLKTHYK
jgi:transposase